MPEYNVRWTMTIDADTPDDAAAKALEIHRDPDSIATSFDVFARVTEPAPITVTRVDFYEDETIANPAAYRSVLALLASVEAWAETRAAASEAEENGEGDWDDWEESDDEAVSLAQEFGAVLRDLLGQGAL